LYGCEGRFQGIFKRQIDLVLRFINSKGETLTVSSIENALEFVKSRLDLEVGIRLKTDLKSADLDLDYNIKVDKKKGSLRLDVKVKERCG